MTDNLGDIRQSVGRLEGTSEAHTSTLMDISKHQGKLDARVDALEGRWAHLGGIMAAIAIVFTALGFFLDSIWKFLVQSN